MKIIQIVRRFGPVGGMERYVWETVLALARQGHEVQVICEYCTEGRKPAGIQVHELGKMVYRPRWLYYWRFGRRVRAWLKANPQPGWLIHSHERTGVHDVTTFHGPPFASVRDRPWWKRISLRVSVQLWMERRELRVAKVIVPNSRVIAQQLAHYYPEYAHKITNPVVPGVLLGVVRAPRAVPSDGGVVGFVGYEWKRKGLPLAVEIVAQLRKQRPNLELWVIGPKEDEVKYLFADWQGGYRLMGWRNDNTYFSDIDVLLHPAKAEPYGMVISEAMAARVPVVVSDVCGAAEQVTAGRGEVIRLQASITEWVMALDKLLTRKYPVTGFARGWDMLALEYAGAYRDVARNG